jgi:hypothetical protein
MQAVLDDGHRDGIDRSLGTSLAARGRKGLMLHGGHSDVDETAAGKAGAEPEDSMQPRRAKRLSLAAVAWLLRVAGSGSWRRRYTPADRFGEIDPAMSFALSRQQRVGHSPR